MRHLSRDIEYSYLLQSWPLNGWTSICLDLILLDISWVLATDAELDFIDDDAILYLVACIEIERSFGIELKCKMCDYDHYSH